MTTLSFKAPDELKRNLALLAAYKGINLSAFIKLMLTESLQKELNRITENGFTVKEELETVYSDLFEESKGPFHSVDELMKSLRKK